MTCVEGCLKTWWKCLGSTSSAKSIDPPLYHVGRESSAKSIDPPLYHVGRGSSAKTAQAAEDPCDTEETACQNDCSTKSPGDMTCVEGCLKTWWKCLGSTSSAKSIDPPLYH